jgi:hypothetical protein
VYRNGELINTQFNNSTSFGLTIDTISSTPGANRALIQEVVYWDTSQQSLALDIQKDVGRYYGITLNIAVQSKY